MPPGLAFESWDPRNLSSLPRLAVVRAADRSRLETPLSPLSLGVTVTGGILGHPGDGALPVCILCRRRLAPQTQQRTGSGQHPEEWTAATLPELQPAPLSNS